MGTNFRWLLVINLLLLSHVIKSQTITGTIQTINGKKISGAILTIKDSINSIRSSEFSIARTGDFSHSLTKKYKNIYVEFSANGYKSQNIEIQNPLKDKTYSYNITLDKDEAINLQEVSVVTKRKAFTIKQDTVDYNVAAFRDGTERKIQDLIKKLPGIDVDEKSGEIRYKGKPVETVKLDGDDLFGSNYALGTKNINVDMVDQVQAIENYSSNPLLSGIETGDKVALNLKLKKGKTDFSGTVDLGSGVFDDFSDAQNLGSTLIGVSKKYKSFSTLTYNNIGQVNSPYDYFTNRQSVAQLKESNQYAQKVISDDFLSSDLDDSRSNINSELFATYNAMFKVSNKFSVKANLYLLDDKILSNQLSINQIYINKDSIVTSDKAENNKNPNLDRGDVELKIHTSPSSLLEYNITAHSENVNIESTNIQNFDKLFMTKLDSRSFFIKSNLLFTKRISDNKALQITINHSVNTIPQSLQIMPSIFSTENTDVQGAEFRKKFLSSSVALLGSAKRLKYNFTAGFNSDISPFRSNLTHQTINQIDFENDIEFSSKSFYLIGRADYSWRKFKISPLIKFSTINQILENFNSQNVEAKSNLLFEPFVAISYKFNDKSGLLNTVGYNMRPLGEEYLFESNVLTSSRVLKLNTPTLALQSIFSASSFYMINDLFNQFQLNLGLSYTRNKGNFFSDIYIQENLTSVNYFFLNENSKLLNTNFRIQKYFSSIESTFRFQTNLSSLQYKNMVNQSDLRTNRVTSINSELFFKTAFDITVNFENIIKYNRDFSKVNNGNQFSNNAINHTFKTILKPNKQVLIIASTDYFIPNTRNKSQDFLFLDASAKYSPKGNPFSFTLIGKNLFNQNTFKQFQVNDYSSSIYQSNLLSRYVLLNISYSF